MPVVYAAKELRMNFPYETTTKGILGLHYPEVTIRTDGESSKVTLSRRDGGNSEEPVSKQCTTQALHTTADHTGHAESGVRIVKEKVRTLVCYCYARELRVVTVGKSHVSLPWCVRCAAQMISRSHRGTNGMTGYRRAHGRSRMPRRNVLWSEKGVLPGAVQEKGPS